MANPAKLFKAFINAPMSFLVKPRIVPDNVIDELEIDPSRPIFYVIKTDSFTDKVALARACKTLSMPSPSMPVNLSGHEVPPLIAIEKPKSLLFGTNGKTNALKIGEKLLAAHQQNRELDAQLIPVSIVWKRAPGKEKAGLQSIMADSESPSWLRKLFIVLFSGRNTFIRFSRPVSIRYMADKHGSDLESGHKLLRVARFHFYRQKLAATGPRLWSKEQMLNSILSAPSVKKAMEDEQRETGKSKLDVKKAVKKQVVEIAADYRESYVRVANRFLTWLWNKLYNGIEVNNAEVVRELAELGHEIIYVPCHRSHMDYLLLSYVIYNQGLVPPHIAAGINLNFGPVGPILRRGGAFFLRRSFKGDKLYAAVFREYLSQLFMKGYSVEYFTEGGRSRTGRLLPPKTGMLAMTIQAMLRGIDRPVTFVPVYLGYEHVMEVSTYLKELKGSAKKSESLGGIFKAVKNLRDYGYGYVNFGNPLTLNEFLNKHVSDWREQIDPMEVQKPTWLTPVCNKLSVEIMRGINHSTALNAATLTAIILLAAEQHTLSREELEAQLNLYLGLQRSARYSELVSIPEQTGKELVDHLIKLRKVEIKRDDFGQMVSFNAEEAVLMTYYRNNIIHLFALPSLIAAQILMHKLLAKEQIIDAVRQLYPLFADEWFLQELDPAEYATTIIKAMIEQKLLIEQGDMLQAPERQSPQRFALKLLANVIGRTLQRYAIVLNLLKNRHHMSREELEEKSLAIAARLRAMYGIKSPEFTDKKVLSAFTTSLKDNGYAIADEQGRLSGSVALNKLTETVTGTLRNDIMQAITQVISRS